jgi:hypothetical protein
MRRFLVLEKSDPNHADTNVGKKGSAVKHIVPKRAAPTLSQVLYVYKVQKGCG